MKKTISLIFLVITLLVPVSCTTPNEKPKDMKEPEESSIFEATQVENVRVTANYLNIRSGANTGFSVVGSLRKGQTVDVVGRLGSWYVIHLPNDLIGCIYSKYAQPIVKEENVQGDRSVNKVYRLTNMEQSMLTLVNQSRSNNNLPPLQSDLELARVARIKSQDLITNDYFSHYSPTYGSPFDMITNFGIDYLYAGENLAGNTTVKRAHNALMNSAGHRKNILNPNFTHIGIGIRKSNKYGYVFTQMFIGKPQ